MRLAASKGHATATDLADYLVNKGLPFRDAHDVVGKLVALAIENDTDLSDMPLATLQAHCELIGDDVDLSLEASVNTRSHIGGTAPASVLLAIQTAKNAMK